MSKLPPDVEITIAACLLYIIGVVIVYYCGNGGNDPGGPSQEEIDELKNK